jgi:stage II sporulation protein D
MTRLAKILLPLALVLPCAAQVGDAGGGDVTVAMFSTRNLHSVTIAPAGAGAWVAACAACKRRPLSAAMHFASGADLLAGGPVKVTEDATGETRTASGLWRLHSVADASVDVALTLPSERYVAAVLNAEAAASEPAESLRALAILARTYALNGRHYTAAAGHIAAQLCDSTECQAMRLAPSSQAVADAVQATAGETLWFGAGRAETYFSQSCGGTTEDAGAVWPALRGTTYLRSHADPYCLRRDAAQWHAEVPLVKLAEIARAERWTMPAKIEAAHIATRSVSHRALRIDFAGAGATSSVGASALRFAVGRALGWNLVRSDLYELAVRNGSLVFDGRGHGHGVGLCQQGATEMAAEGRGAAEILAFYFPGTAVRITPADDGWHETAVGPLTVRATYKLGQHDVDELQQAWADAKRRFPPRRVVHPRIIFAPSTEMFRQLTGEPGWELASTAGDTIVLQPREILRANGTALSATLLHEMLHALVESEANAHTPLWLREGLVEALAGAPAGRVGAMTTEAMDEGLSHPVSRIAAMQSHRAAAARVQAFIARYGLSTVRGWLSSGVPAGAE